MKLLFCKACVDVRKLSTRTITVCDCGASKGKYLEDGLNATVEGDRALVLGFDNNSLRAAIMQDGRLPKEYGAEGEPGVRFEAFIIPNSARSVKRA